MKITEEEYTWIKQFFIATDQIRNDLSEWDQKFLYGLRERFMKFRRNMFVSEKQWEQINRIAEDNLEGPE